MTRAKCRCICQFYFICLLIVLKIPLRWNILITGSWIDGRIFLSRKSFVLRLANLFEAIIQYSIACQMNSIVCVMLYFFLYTLYMYIGLTNYKQFEMPQGWSTNDCSSVSSLPTNQRTIETSWVCHKVPDKLKLFFIFVKRIMLKSWWNCGI